jgi:hypothetical protein
MYQCLRLVVDGVVVAVEKVNFVVTHTLTLCTSHPQTLE